MSVARSQMLFSLHTQSQAFNHDALVVGGGVAGMTAALNLADQGYHVYLVERQAELGGRMRQVYHNALGGDPQTFLFDLVGRVKAHPYIEVRKRHAHVMIHHRPVVDKQVSADTQPLLRQLVDLLLSGLRRAAIRVKEVKRECVFHKPPA